MFENLVERFDSVFSNLKKTGSINDEKSLDEAMRSISAEHCLKPTFLCSRL